MNKAKLGGLFDFADKPIHCNPISHHFAERFCCASKFQKKYTSRGTQKRKIFFEIPLRACSRSTNYRRIPLLIGFNENKQQPTK